MEQRFWFTSCGSGCRLTKSEPLTASNAKVTVRATDPDQPSGWDGVWVDGERSYDTYVIIDGWVTYHAPAQYLAEQVFDQHEERGGGRSIEQLSS